MSCNSQTLSGIVNDCLPSMGGVAEVLVANYTDIAGVALDSENNIITAINLAEGVSAPFKRYYMPNGVAYMEQTPTIDRATGANYVETVLFMQFNRMNAAKHAEMRALTLNDLAVIVKDNNGSYWFLGKDRPVQAGGSPTSGTGTAFADANRYAVELHDIAQANPYEISVGTSGVDIDALVG